MNHRFPARALLVACVLPAVALAQTPPVAGAGAPRGEVLKFSFEQSKIFPGTSRDYWVYVPAQYRPDRPACVYVNQDGIQWEAPAVFDQLIHTQAMPVTIGVFVMPGRVKAADTNAARDRLNRSFEYDSLSDNYARFLLEELLPGRGDQNHLRRPRDPAFDQRQRPRHRRLEQRRDLRLHRGVGTAGRLPPRVQRHRQLRRPARRGPLSDAHSQDRAQADPHFPPGRHE